MNHYVLKTLPIHYLRDEVLKSSERIDNVLQQKTKHFAYPYGGKKECAKREFDFIKMEKFGTGVTTRFSNIFKNHKYHTECLPRIFVPGDADESFLTQVLNGTLSARVNRFRRNIGR
jgi:peptidoglycan/xylan/chitin deacetylase (PgdA/CDA1 family)